MLAARVSMPDFFEWNIAEDCNESIVRTGKSDSELILTEFNVAAVAVFVRQSSERVIGATAARNNSLSVSIGVIVVRLARQETDETSVWSAQELSVRFAILVGRREENFFELIEFGAFGFDLFSRSSRERVCAEIEIALTINVASAVAITSFFIGILL
jgi:hypothetical protein